MTTYLIYADTNDGYLQSTSTSFSSAVAGSNLVMNNTATTARTGMNKGSTGSYAVYESFWSFDTSVIGDTEEVVDATVSMYLGYTSNQTVWWDMQLREFAWTAPLTTAQWKSVASLKTYPLRASFDFMGTSSAYRYITTGADSLAQNINKTAAMKFIGVSSRQLDGSVPTGTEEMWAYSANTGGTNKPFMTVYTVPLSMLNAVSEAATTLSDGTTISIRSNGTSSNNLTVGYTTLASSTWTSIAALSASLQPNLDGNNSVAITSDPAGNFYIIGQRTLTPGNLYAQAFKKTGPTTWVAQNALAQPMPVGNEQSIKSIAAQYMPGGSDANDKPSIHVLLARGASGVNLNYRYHVSGTGLVQNAQLNPENLLAGSGTLINGAAGFNPGASALPAFVDMCPVGDHLNACYVQRGKVNGATVGGIAMIQTYNKGGKYTATNSTYVATGASQLVPISDKMFAHVFDENGLKLTVRFYNAQAQVLGETNLPKESFFNSVIGTQFAAYYDKTSNVVRVFYVDSSSSRTLSRFDVSPLTFSGTTTLSVVTNLGAASSINTDLRVSRTSDERRVMIEAASNAAGVLSVATAFSTVGNLAPNAPALTARPNFDAAFISYFYWTPSDPNPADYQTAFQLEVSRVSDSAIIGDTGKVVSTITNGYLPANTLVNGENYRWRVRTWDVLDTVGAWSNYGTFSTSATGTVTITSPATDNLAGIETDDYTITWTYEQSTAATQAQRRVRLIRTADGAVISDSTMQASTSNSYTVSGMESGKEYRVEVTLINTSAITTSVATRLISPYYSEPMTPEVTINVSDAFVELIVLNPEPTGDRPEVIFNDIYRRRTKANSVDSDFIRIATITNSATYRDYAVKSETSYDYKVVGRTV